MNLELSSIAMRWLLGMLEAGFFPGVAYYLSWYVNAISIDEHDVHTSTSYVAGTSTQSTESAWRYFSPLQLFQGHLEGSSP